MAIKSFIFFAFILLSGCTDNSIVNIKDKTLLTQKIPCMRLLVFPPNILIEQKLKTLYPFKEKCDINFLVSYKSGIVCNSNQNSNNKALGMPSSYLRYELKKHNRLLYSYYIDLDGPITQQDINDGFDRIKKDLTFTTSKQ